MFKKFSTVLLVNIVAFCVGLGVGDYVNTRNTLAYTRNLAEQQQRDVIQFTENTDARFYTDVCRHMMPVFSFNEMALDRGDEPVEIDPDIARICSDDIQLAGRLYRQGKSQ